MKPHDLTGRRFGKLVVLNRGINNAYGKSRWLCRCDCGTEKLVTGSVMVRGEARSCGCLRIEVPAIVNYKHGHSAGTPTYRSWQSMTARTTNPNNPNFHKYGAIGIGVCKRWRSFTLFLVDMGERPPHTTLDRIDNSKGYEPSNCRWATPKQQAKNSSNPRLITFNGITRNVSEWAEHIGIAMTTLLERLEKWPLEEALTTPRTTRWTNPNMPL